MSRRTYFAWCSTLRAGTVLLAWPSLRQPAPGWARSIVGVFGLVLLLGPFAAAQAPDVRVHLLSQFHLSQVTIVPGANTSIVRNNRPAQTLRAALAVSISGKSLAAGETTASRLTVRGDFQIVSEGARTQNLHVPLEISVHEGFLRMVASLPVEDYVAAVVQGETAGDMPPEALKALAVAVRSYTAHFRERHRAEGFDFCDTTHCQYLRMDVLPRVRAAVQPTAGELLWDRGTPLAAYYHKDCGGRTEAAGALWPDQQSPFLVVHADPYCLRTTQPWRAEITRADLQRALTNAGLKVPPGWNRITISERRPSGRAQTLRFSLGNAEQGAPVSASSLRFAVGRTLGWNTLKSDWYDVSGAGDHFLFTGRGVGHGVGLCQTGAAEMAREGKTYREILAFYYPGAPIGRSAQGIPWITTSTAALDLRVVNSADAAPTLHAAHAALGRAEQQTGLTLKLHPEVEIYPSVAMFRDATGEPGWVAASTRNQKVRLQPLSKLGNRLPGVLRHEFLHLLVESNAKQDTPLWFREGLVVYLTGDPPPATVSMSPNQIEDAIRSRSSRPRMQQAYTAAAALVRDLDHRHGRTQLLQWLHNGLPEGVVPRLTK